MPPKTQTADTSLPAGLVKTSCPVCGGTISLSDGFPAVKPRYRYMIACDDHDCEAVIGPSVGAVVRLWNDVCAKYEPTRRQP